MFPNLRAELARKRITYQQIGQLIGKSKDNVYAKMAGKTDFKLNEMLLIKESYFKDLELEYLFYIDEEERKLAQ